MDIFNKEKVRNLKEHIEVLKREVSNREKLVGDNVTLKDAIINLTTKLNDKILKIREQTEADIYLSCHKIMKGIEGGDKITELQPQIDYMERLRTGLGQQQLASPNPLARIGQAPAGGLFGAMTGRW